MNKIDCSGYIIFLLIKLTILEILTLPKLIYRFIHHFYLLLVFKLRLIKIYSDLLIFFALERASWKTIFHRLEQVLGGGFWMIQAH